MLNEAITCGNSDIVKYLISLEDFNIKSIKKNGILINFFYKTLIDLANDLYFDDIADILKNKISKKSNK